jgi:hypothetical protein
VKFDKEITDNNSNMKIYLNKNKDNKDNKDNRDTNSNKLHLNTDRSNDAYNIDNISKIIKIPIKDNSNKKNNKKIILPISTGSNSNSITQNKKCVKGIYIKPTLSRSKSKNKNKKSNSEAKTKCDYFLKNRNIISSNKKVKSRTKSLNNEKHLYTPPCIFPIQDKYNLLLKINNTRKKVSKSANTLSDSSIDNSNIVKKKRKKLDYDLISERSENNAKETFIKKYCFYSKYYNYFLRREIINICYITKQNTKNQLNKEQTIQINISNKDEKINNNYIIKKLSNTKINNEEEKINESSQNGLIMTFGDANDNKNKNEKINSKNNDLISQLNNDIIIDESLKSDIDIYKKLNILQPESKNIIEDNISENEDIQFCFSDEEGGTTEINFPGPLYNSNKSNNIF